MLVGWIGRWTMVYREGNNIVFRYSYADGDITGGIVTNPFRPDFVSEIASYLTSKLGIPFRKAMVISGRLVDEKEFREQYLSTLPEDVRKTIEDVLTFYDKINNEAWRLGRFILSVHDPRDIAHMMNLFLTPEFVKENDYGDNENKRIRVELGKDFANTYGKSLLTISVVPQELLKEYMNIFGELEKFIRENQPLPIKLFAIWGYYNGAIFRKGFPPDEEHIKVRPYGIVEKAF